MDQSVPNAAAAFDAVRTLHEAMTAALRDPSTSADPEALSALAGQLAWSAERLTWCRDAALHLARRAPEPEHRTEWLDLERATDVADSTLIGRLQRWRHRNREVIR